jgi:Tat protein translocase TatB subunit
MFGIGYQEMFVVLVVAMIIFGPSRLPELAGQVGRWVREFRKMSSDLTGEFEKTFAEVDEVKKSFTRELQSIQDEVEGVGQSTRGELKKSARTATAGKKAVGAGTESATNGKSGSAEASANGSRSKIPALKTSSAGKAGARALAGTVPLATKDDPLADVSFFDVELITAKNGRSNGAAAEIESALSRVRKRRAAGYGRRVVAS